MPQHSQAGAVPRRGVLRLGEGGTMEWISVRDREPEEDGARVIFCARGEIRLGRYYTKLPFPFEDDKDGYSAGEVSYWLPLPPKPQESKDG